ncbi:MAG: hypothetical protein HZA89_17765 [Verrucomicrobia bacterium]|nr:hypothetical protein [Verrucomicrobiota bacterium]
MTLLEVMIAATLMSVIIYALYTMFDRVQRVLRAGTAQVDVLEAGRVVTEMIERDLEQMSISGGIDETNILTTVDYTDYSAGGGGVVTANMSLPDGTWVTNELHSLFFLTRPDSWKAIGYRIAHPANVTEPPPNGVGTLYRFERTIVSPSALTNRGSLLTTNPIHRFFSVANAFIPRINPPSSLGDTNILNEFSRVLDGVVNFQCRIIAYNPARTDGTNYYRTNAIERSSLPVFVEVDIGLLEPKVLEQIRALEPGSPAAYSILTNQFGKVHTFAQRIPIRMRP